MKRKVCVVTGSRAEFGILYPLIEAIRDSELLELQLVTTGSHLAQSHGQTGHFIDKTGLVVDRKIEMLLDSDSSVSAIKSMGVGLISFADALNELSPDALILLGDRYEILAVAVAAFVSGIPICHLHGGEVTRASFDDSIRHSITKMSQLHFVSNAKYRNRVIQMGEAPDRVFNTGALGVDVLNKIETATKNELEKELKFKFGAKNLLVTFHPETLGSETQSRSSSEELLNALGKFPDIHLIFTAPNADPGNDDIKRQFISFAENRENAAYFNTLGQRNFLSCLKIVDGVIGNSSSGIIEAPAAKVGTVNIGMRQDGREKAQSVIDCLSNERDICIAIEKLYSDEFRKRLKDISNPYGDGKACDRIMRIISEYPFEKAMIKNFFDLENFQDQ